MKKFLAVAILCCSMILSSCTIYPTGEVAVATPNVVVNPFVPYYYATPRGYYYHHHYIRPHHRPHHIGPMHRPSHRMPMGHHMGHRGHFRHR